jgi:uncharacterized protein YdaL
MSSPLSGTPIAVHARLGVSLVATDVIRVLWFVAGAAMLLFTLFLAVLLVAGLAFRLGHRATRHRSAVVFWASAAVVALSSIALLLPHPLPSVKAAFNAGRDGTAQGEGDRSQPAADIPVRYVNGAATGSGLVRTTGRSLVLYDTSGPSPESAELHATLLVNMISHFGGWTAHPVNTYQAGESSGYDAVFYLGEPAGAALPAAFLDDVLHAGKPVVWIDGDIDQLQARGGVAWSSRHGFTPQGTATPQFVRMDYKGTTLPMDPGGGAAVTRLGIDDPKKATVLATAWLADGSSEPWAVRSGNLIYLSEDPLSSVSHVEGRNLVFADLLFEALDPGAGQRHRALVRLEDVNPTSDPTQLRAITDYLSGQGVPFSVGVFPVYRDPNGVGGSGDVTIKLSERPQMVAALAYAVAHGGSLVLHGYTHQYAAKDNPYHGRSADDAEFYLCHLNADQQMTLDGPVPEDSEAWALGRIDQALAELQTAGLPRPSMLEFPHYMASAADYAAAAKRFQYRYERTLYFPGLLSGTPVDTAQPGWQFFPYTVRDAYGTTVIPENLDYVHSDVDSVPGMLDTARANLVVRDGVASFFYHPFLGVGSLPRLVDGLRTLGYTFVAAQDLAGAP